MRNMAERRIHKHLSDSGLKGQLTKNQNIASNSEAKSILKIAVGVGMAISAASLFATVPAAGIIIGAAALRALSSSGETLYKNIPVRQKIKSLSREIDIRNGKKSPSKRGDLSKLFSHKARRPNSKKLKKKFQKVKKRGLGAIFDSKAKKPKKNSPKRKATVKKSVKNKATQTRRKASNRLGPT